MTRALRSALAFAAVVGISLAIGYAWIHRERPMQWELGRDGWESSYFTSREQNIGPTYLRRRLHTEFCEFGDFPDDGTTPVTRVACGETWTDSFKTFSLTCECPR